VREALPPAQAVLDCGWSLGPALDHAADQLCEAIARISLQSSTLLETQLQRALLERRAFRRRVVLGEERLRFDLAMDTGTAVPTYLPAALEKTLPLYPSLPARLLAEIHHGLDAFDAPAESLVACAVARLAPHTSLGTRKL
jgi:hypothetical protein